MHNPLAFARKATDKTHRAVRFIPALARTLAAHLPETTHAIPPRAPRWLTFRLRPEIAATIEALQARYEGNHKDGLALTASEVLAAVLTEGLPIVAGKPEFR